ncbi:MAG: GTP-dependent dephospho-CoA kinase family protein [Nitrosopumilaceae archaeon]
MHLPENLRSKLKEPFGILIRNVEVTKENVSKHLPQDSFVISVGDATTERLIDLGLPPSIQIVDGLEKRVKRAPPSTNVATDLTCNNPPAQITQESMDVIKKALQSPKPARITVTGEEDLLVLPVCLLAPIASIVTYGQPNEGLVIIKVTPEIKNKSRSIIELMS